MKASLQLKLSQHLALTPQLQQSIKLLQLSTVELNQELERFIAENPLLERIDATTDSEGDIALSENGQPVMNGALGTAGTSATTTAEAERNERTERGEDAPDDFDRYSDRYGENSENMRSLDATSTRRDGMNDNDGDEFGAANQLAAAEPTLQEHLLQQLTLTNLSERDKQIAAYVVAHLDDDGYLTQDLEELVAQLPFELEVEKDDLQIALKHVQHLEPTGVAARNLNECLKLQLLAMPITTPHRHHAILLVEQHIELLAQRDFLKLKRALKVNDEQLKAIRALIVSLDPKPGRGFSAGDIRYVTADVVVKKVQGKWLAMLNNDAVPRLRVNKLYADLVQKSRDTDGKNLHGQLQEARWLIKNIQQRFDTILKVTNAIVENQRHFFEHGEIAMRPLVLREIADQVGLHESTVSRVTTQKYMLTPRGIFELKYFFGSSVATEAGGACSATAIRALIRQMVDAEDQRKPLSDNKIADLLSDQGILVARRTVAKYRESMQIQPANLRKSL
jgi:RNA polymerase sigma-54 factor